MGNSISEGIAGCHYFPEGTMKPVIDVHEHIFRGRDIPLKGYLLSREYEEWYIRWFAPVLFAIIERAIRGEIKGLPANLVLGAAEKYMGSGYRRWVDILSLRDVGEITAKLVETFQKNRIDVYVPLMIDFDYWFKDPRPVSIAEQIDTVYRKVVLPYKGRIHPFAPFDPARELAYRAGLPGPSDPDDGPPEIDSSLELAKEAIRRKGFIGVKVYNTLGYRPLGNAAVDDKRRWIFKRNGRTRYASFTGEEFDQVLCELYDFCEREEVPITAHCVSNGIEAYPGASFDFGDPKFWRPVLDRYPRLHLNLAHFGWSSPEGYLPKVHWALIRRSWQRMLEAVGDGEQTGGGNRGETWVGEICEMMEKYEYLYADVAHHMVMEDADIPKFQESYRAICAVFPRVIPPRLLFGIDWHVITRVDRFTEFVDRYVRVLSGGNIFSGKEMEDFFGGNALHFLGLLAPGTRSKAGWTGNRKRLRAFYKRKHIRPPKWFQSTDKPGSTG
jgi:predicted TIM-barrel fold metal-dependent hydrolase